VGGRVGIGNVGIREIGRMWKLCLRFELWGSLERAESGAGYAG
jgi:hypothetical protein